MKYQPVRPVPPGLVDVSGIAARMGCGLKDAYDWVKECPGITFKAGGRYLVAEETLSRWIAGDPEVRRAACLDPNPKPAQQPATPWLRTG